MGRTWMTKAKKLFIERAEGKRGTTLGPMPRQKNNTKIQLNATVVNECPTVFCLLRWISRRLLQTGRISARGYSE
jgi:hypothetical protein